MSGSPFFVGGGVVQGWPNPSGAALLLRVTIGTALVASSLIAIAVIARPAAGQSMPSEGGVPGSSLALAQSTGKTTVAKDPPAANLFLGRPELIVVERVAGVPAGRGAGSYQIRVAYDRDVVTVEIEDGSFLRSTGRTPFCLQAAGEGLAVLSCFTVGSGSGPTGAGILAAITIRPVEGLHLRAAANNGIETLIDDISAAVRLSDTSGQTIPIASVGDAAVIVRALEGDLNSDCRVDVADSQMIAGRLGVVLGMAPYSPFFDLEPGLGPDGDIDVRDLQVVFGRHGSTCDAPRPDQYPLGGAPPTATPTGTPTPTATATRTPTRTPTPTATPCPDYDSDGLCNAIDPDDDNDRCGDASEQQTSAGSEVTGGRRNYHNFWDFFDPTRDKSVSGLDLFALLERFGSTGNPAIDPLSPALAKPAYHTRFDRGSSTGPNIWNLSAANGSIGGTDFFSILAQFQHACP